MFFRKRRRRILHSPAASLMPQIQAQLERKRRVRRRIIDSDTPDDSHGKLFMYFSAGGLVRADDSIDRRFYIARSPRLAIFLTILLIAIYFIYR